MPLDVGSFEKIRAFVKDFKAKNQPLNILINNAGVKTLSQSLRPRLASVIVLIQDGMHMRSMQRLPFLISTPAQTAIGGDNTCSIRSSNIACMRAGIHVPGGDAPEESGQRTPEGFEVHIIVTPSLAFVCIGHTYHELEHAPVISGNQAQSQAALAGQLTAPIVTLKWPGKAGGPGENVLHAMQYSSGMSWC